MDKNGKVGAAIALTLLALGSLAASSATDAAKPPTCMVVLEPVKPGEKHSEITEVICWDKPPAVDPFANDFDDITGNETNGVPFGRETYYALARDHAPQYHGSPHLTWTTTNPDRCNEGEAYWAPSMPSGWNDVVSSAQTAGGSGCTYHVHFEHTYYGGSIYDCGTSCSTMPAYIDNKTSSVIVW